MDVHNFFLVPSEDTEDSSTFEELDDSIQFEDLEDLEDLEESEELEELEALFGNEQNTFGELPPSPLTEVTEEMADAGADIQGIPLHTWMGIDREGRLRHYDSVNRDLQDARKDINTISLIRPQTPANFFKFKYTKLDEEVCHIAHFQLRNLCWANSKNDVFYICEKGNVVRQWSPHRRTSRRVIDLTFCYDLFMNPIRLSTMTCRDNLLLAGGYFGEYAIRRLDSYETRLDQGHITTNLNGITNHMEIVRNRSGALKVAISSNDYRARLMDLETQKFDSTFEFPWAVNCTAFSPDRRLLCAVGDDPETFITDVESGEVLKTMKDHIDFSFACAWSPDSRFLCTGNQDKTTRVYDTRNFSKPLTVLAATMGPIRSLRFTEDGKFLAMAEPMDFVHIFNTSTFEESQTINIYGDIGGFSFTPDGDSLFIANCYDHEQYGSILEYGRLSNPLSLYNVWL